MGGGSGDYKIHGVPPQYGLSKYGPPLAHDNAAFASGVKAGVQAEPHPKRTSMSPGEAAGARLTVSPSMKMPEQSPVPTQGGGRIVPSTPSRQGSFSAGQQDMYRG